MLEQISFANIESAARATRNHFLIDVDTLCWITLVPQQAQPFSAAATEIEQGNFSPMRLEFLQIRQINEQSLADLLLAPAEFLFQLQIQFIEAINWRG